MILMIDNYDSFTFNIVQYLGQIGEDVNCSANDRITLDDIMKSEGPRQSFFRPDPVHLVKQGSPSIVR